MAKQSLCYTHTQVSSALKVFLSQSKTWHSECPQTSRPAFLVEFSAVLKVKRPHKHPGNAYFVVWKVGMTHTYVKENEEWPGGFAGRILKE